MTPSPPSPPSDVAVMPGRMARAKSWWHDDVDRWMKVVITVVAFATGLYTCSGWIDGVMSWYLQRSALAGDIQKLERKVDTGQRLILQDQEIRYGREIRDMEKHERAGRLSPAEEAWLDVLRRQQREVRQQLRQLPSRP
jgi:hypothetical protein